MSLQRYAAKAHYPLKLVSRRFSPVLFCEPFISPAIVDSNEQFGGDHQRRR